MTSPSDPDRDARPYRAPSSPMGGTAAAVVLIAAVVALIGDAGEVAIAILPMAAVSIILPILLMSRTRG